MSGWESMDLLSVWSKNALSAGLWSAPSLLSTNAGLINHMILALIDFKAAPSERPSLTFPLGHDLLPASPHSWRLSHSQPAKKREDIYDNSAPLGVFWENFGWRLSLCHFFRDSRALKWLCFMIKDVLIRWRMYIRRKIRLIFLHSGSAKG